MPASTTKVMGNRRRLIRTLALCVGAILIQYCVLGIAQTEDVETGFIRFLPGLDPWQGELQTAVVSYRNQQGIMVDLVAAVHIADTEYYQQLNDYFTSRDRVLYELVAEENEVPSLGTGSGSRSPLGFIQQTLANFLRVSFQLQQIDYTAPNFRHADLTPSQLREIMQSKNENFFSMFLSLALAQSAELQSPGATSSATPTLTMMAIMNALNAENQNDAFKSLFAEELGRSGGDIVGPVLQEQLTILGDRNKVVLNTLRDTLLEPQVRTVSIFFGAAHMSGLERELTESMGFERVEHNWRAAWTIP